MPRKKKFDDTEARAVEFIRQALVDSRYPMTGREIAEDAVKRLKAGGILLLTRREVRAELQPPKVPQFARAVAVDFDGVVHRYSRGWHNGQIYDEPMDGALEGLEQLASWGFDLVIFTARDDLDPVRDWLAYYREKGGYTFQFEVTNMKPPALIYIDDRGYKFESWTRVVADFYKRGEVPV